MSELSWNERIDKHANGIDLDESAAELDEYIGTKIYTYETENLTDDTLWATYQDEFESFTVEIFQKIRPILRGKLRVCLLQRGIYLQAPNKSVIISQTLYDVLQEDSYQEWTDDQVQEAARRVAYLSQSLKDQLAEITATQRAITLTRGPPTPVRQAPTPGPIPGHGHRTSITSVQEPTLTPGPLQPLSTVASSPVFLQPSTTPTPIQLRVTSQDPTYQNTLSPELSKPVQPNQYGREIATIAKVYSDDQKYSGVSDSFDFKLMIFQDICFRSGLPPSSYMAALPIMLKGLAQSHYYNSGLLHRSYEDACLQIRNFFEGPEYYRTNLVEWNNINLQQLIDSNPEKSIADCLQLLIDKLCKQQHTIDPDFRTTKIMTNKLATACQGVPACRIAISNPSEDLNTLINKLQSSIMAWEKENPRTITTYFTDRRYYRGQQNGRFQGRNSKGAQPPDRKARCYICKREDCRSYKHPEAEQEKARNSWKSKFNSRTKDRFASQSGERFSQFLTSYEGDTDTDSDTDADEIFEGLILDVNLDQDSSTTSIPDATTQLVTAYITSYGSLSLSRATALTSELADRAFSHLLDPVTDLPRSEVTASYALEFKSRYGPHTFMGIVVDTGASTKSTGGYSQFSALQQTIPGLELDTSTKGQVTVQFGVGIASSIGTVTIRTPLGDVQFHIVEPETPFLLCLADMDRLHAYLDNTRDVLVTPQGEVPIVRRFGHAFLLYDSSLQIFLLESLSQDPCYLSEVELQRLHRRFGHPSVDRLHKVLDRAGQDHDRAVLEHLTKYCHYCQKHGRSPGRFKFTVRDDVEFNFNIIVDIMYISGNPILHIVDEATRFQAGRWLLNISAKHTWETLQSCWIDTYLGPPDNIITDAGKNFVSKEFSEYATALNIRTRAVPVEAHNSIGMVERYHGPIRRAYQIIRTELPDATKEAALQMAFKAINDTAGPEGLVPTLLVFGAYPRMSNMDPPALTVVQRANAIKKAMIEVRKLRAERQIADALNTRNGPNTSAIHDLPVNSQVLVWREGNIGQLGQWKGPYRLLTTEGETCTVLLKSGPTPFRITVVKPYHQEERNTREATTPEELSNPTPVWPEPVVKHTTLTPVQKRGPGRPRKQPLPISTELKRGRGRPRKYPLLTAVADVTILVQDDNSSQFKASRQKELTGLLEKGVFEITKPVDIPQGTRLFNSRFVDEIKHPGTTKAFEKSRLVVQAYNDQEKDIVLTQSPTIQRVSQRLILCLAAISLHKAELYLRDISQAYVQSTTLLNREFYVRPPQELQTELGLGEDAVLKVLKPLYGVPEAGNHWFKTYHSHHVDQLGMDQSTYDPCLLHSNSPSKFGVVGLQTDDTLILGDDVFAASEQEKLTDAKFLAKEREKLTATAPLKFNGGLIQMTATGDITLTQAQQCDNLRTTTTRAENTKGSKGVTRTLMPKEQYIAQRARGAYVASVCQPEASFALSVAAQAVDPTYEDHKALNKCLDWQIANPERGLKFVQLDINTLQLIVFTDASFANNKDLSSQMGYVIVLADATKKANVIHWSSVKCKRVTRSVLASELYGMTHGFDISVALKSTIDNILHIDLPLILCTDSKSLYDCLVRLGTTQEKRLMIDVMCLRQAYERRLITEVRWINGDSNPADAMTKSKPCTALTQLIDTNRIDMQAIGWVERTIVDLNQES